MIRAKHRLPLIVIVGVGCSQPAMNPSFESGTPPERTMAATESARTGDTSKIPLLISMLSSADPAQRMIASDALERLTGQTLGYHFADPEVRRNQAVGRWHAWYESGGEAGGDSAP